MKFLTRNTILTIALAFTLPAYIFASSGSIVAHGNVKAKTKTVCVNSATIAYEKAILVNFNFEDEGYINDIPFGDKTISSEELYQKAIAVDYEFEEESYIDDINLNTHESVL